MKKIKILHYIPNFKYGGIETNIISLLNNIDDDIIFDFLIENTDIPVNFEKLVEVKNGKIFNVPNFKKHPLENVKKIDKLIKDGDYDVVEVHSFSTRPFVLKIANNNNVRNRILHIHSISRNNNKHKRIKKINELIAIKNANHFIACSKEAGEAFLKNKKMFILPNGIDIKKFEYNEEYRKEYRKNLGIENKKVYGHVGRFTFLKNHKYLIEVFKNILIKEPNSVLLLVGTGEEKNNILKSVADIKGNVIILEDREDVNKILSAMDIFIFPSLTEGFGIALLEAQANGLPCFVTYNISNNVVLLDNVKKINIDEQPNKTADLILQTKLERKNNLKELDYYSSDKISNKYFEYIKSMIWFNHAFTI